MTRPPDAAPLDHAAEQKSHATRGVVSFSKMGTFGYFGNQVLQYAFIKTYARQHGFDCEVAPWIGNYLFGTRDNPISATRPAIVDVDPRLIRQETPPPRDCDFEGYFQYHTSRYAAQRAYIRSLFRPTEEVAALVVPGWQRIRERGKTLVGLHLRRGDFGQGFVYITPTSWYLKWLDDVWPTLDDPVLYVASDNPSLVVRDFARYRPATAADMGVKMFHAPYYPDFFALTQCDLLAIPNSSFSFVAAMLNERLQRSVRSVLPLQSFVAFDPWNDDPLYREHSAEEFAHIPGVKQTRFQRCVWLLRRLKMKLTGRGRVA